MGFKWVCPQFSPHPHLYSSRVGYTCRAHVSETKWNPYTHAHLAHLRLLLGSYSQPSFHLFIYVKRTVHINEHFYKCASVSLQPNFQLCIPCGFVAVYMLTLPLFAYMGFKWVCPYFPPHPHLYLPLWTLSGLWLGFTWGPTRWVTQDPCITHIFAHMGLKLDQNGP